MTWDEVRKQLWARVEYLGLEVFRQAWMWAYFLESEKDSPPDDVSVNGPDEVKLEWHTPAGKWMGEIVIRKDGGNRAWDENGGVKQGPLVPWPPFNNSVAKREEIRGQ
jgi:hypothetical protein